MCLGDGPAFPDCRVHSVKLIRSIANHVSSTFSGVSVGFEPFVFNRDMRYAWLRHKLFKPGGGELVWIDLVYIIFCFARCGMVNQPTFPSRPSHELYYSN